MGIDAQLLLLGDEDGPRSAVADLAQVAGGKLPDWIKRSPIRTITAALRDFPNSRELQTYFAGFDVAITSGIISLELAPIVPLPKAHISVGYEIAVCPFHQPALRPKRPWTARRLASEALNFLFPDRVRSANDVVADNELRGPRTRAGIQSLDLIFDGYIPNIEALQRLGQAGKLVVSSIGEDVEANRARVDRSALARISAEYARYEKVFVWLSRLNFIDPEGGQAYKGVERYWAALERHADLVTSGRVALVFGRHGNNAEEFLQRIKDSPILPHVRWLPHLRWAEVLTWLSLPNAILFSEFGERQRDLSGIARDAISLGTPVVSSAEPEHVATQLGASPPFLRAVTAEEIDARISQIMAMSAVEDARLRTAMRSYGQTYLDYPAYMNRFWPRVIDMLNARVRDAI